jgi:uncharacterized repeat protein (TIGR03806 family)
MRQSLFSLVACGLALIGLGGCDRTPPQPKFFAETNPEKLSDWGVVAASGGRLVLGTGVVPYDLATPLFTDYAGKLRTIYLPKGTAANYQPANAFDFPVGTIISKTFYYPTPDGADKMSGQVRPALGADTQSGADGLDLKATRLVETRILVRREAGWQALPYVWDDDQSEATLMRTGTIVSLTLDRHDGTSEPVIYAVPNVNQCASCHTPDNASRQLAPIGLKARHLNRSFPYADGAENQLAHLTRIGYLAGAPAAETAPRNADWQDQSATLEARARAYLDINCSHCHSATGMARTTGLQLDASVTEARRLGLCKPPTAAGPGTGDHIFDIVPGKPDDSILPFRLAGTRPGIRMPEVGRSIVHREGLALIRQWIADWPGECQTE